MASQRISVAKIGGVAAEAVRKRFDRWSAACNTADQHEWALEKWPLSVRCEIDAFADQLRTYAYAPPVVYFAEWSDLWSMWDVFQNCFSLKSEGCRPPVFGDRYELWCYALPDEGRLRDRLAQLKPEWPESQLLVQRLNEALTAWGDLVEQVAIVLCREVVGGLVTDDELVEALQQLPRWLEQDDF